MTFFKLIDKLKTSVIIHIYNIDKYIDKCISSVRNQTLREIEKICVDDCSPDNRSNRIGLVGRSIACWINCCMKALHI